MYMMLCVCNSCLSTCKDIIVVLDKNGPNILKYFPLLIAFIPLPQKKKNNQKTVVVHCFHLITSEKIIVWTLAKMNLTRFLASKYQLMSFV